MLQAFEERVAWRQVELQGGIAALKIEIDEDHAPLQLLGDVPGGIDGDHRAADATLHAQDRDELADPQPRLHLVADKQRLAAARELIQHQRLEEIFGHADIAEIAIERDIAALADHDHRGRGIAHVGEAIERLERLGDARYVDDQNPRRALLLNLAGRIAQRAAQDGAVTDADLHQAFADDLFGLGIVDEGHHRRRPGFAGPRVSRFRAERLNGVSTHWVALGAAAAMPAAAAGAAAPFGFPA